MVSSAACYYTQHMHANSCDTHTPAGYIAAHRAVHETAAHITHTPHTHSVIAVEYGGEPSLTAPLLHLYTEMSGLVFRMLNVTHTTLCCFVCVLCALCVLSLYTHPNTQAHCPTHNQISTQRLHIGQT